MTTWPELFAHLKHLQKLVAKHQGRKRKDLERRIAALLARATNIRSREFEAATRATSKIDSPSTGWISRDDLAGEGPAIRRLPESGDREFKGGAEIGRKRAAEIAADSNGKPAVPLERERKTNAGV
jgi:hypothetical protein